MIVFLVAADIEIAHRRHFLVGNHPDRYPHRPEIAGRHPGGIEHLLVIGQFHVGRPEEILQFDLLHFPVAADQHRNRLAVGHENQGLDQPGRFDAQEIRRPPPPCVCRGSPPSPSRPVVPIDVRRREFHRRLFHIGGILAILADDNGIFAGFGKNHELMGETAADRPRVGLHGPEFETAAGEYPLIGLIHLHVGNLRRLVAHIERIGIFHDEFPAAHEAESRPDLVAELGLDLIEIDRQIPIGMQFLAGDVGDDLLMGRPEAGLPFVPVMEAQQFRAVFFISAGLLPQIGRLHHGHQQFLGTGPVHLLADDVLDFADRRKTKGQIGIDTGGELAHEPGPQHEDVADNFGFGRAFFEGRQE